MRTLLALCRRLHLRRLREQFYANVAAQDLVTLQGSGGVSVSTAGSTITIGAPSGSMVLGPPGDTTR
jgi:hypothetical protein